MGLGQDVLVNVSMISAGCLERRGRDCVRFGLILLGGVNNPFRAWRIAYREAPGILNAVHCG